MRLPVRKLDAWWKATFERHEPIRVAGAFRDGDERYVLDLLELGGSTADTVRITLPSNTPISGPGRRGRKSTFTKKYEALVGRLRRRRIDLPLLSHGDAEPFAKVWIDALALPLESSPSKKRPKLDKLVATAWNKLNAQRELFSTEKATPRQ